MARFCEKCGAEIADDWTVCRKCFEPVKRPGFLSRLLRLFGGARISVGKPSRSAGGLQVNVNVSERIKIRDATTGEVREYDSIDEVPMEYREKILQAREALMTGQRSISRISVTDASGTVHNYNSPDELPAELRALYEQAQRPKS